MLASPRHRGSGSLWWVPCAAQSTQGVCPVQTSFAPRTRGRATLQKLGLCFAALQEDSYAIDLEVDPQTGLLGKTEQGWCLACTQPSYAQPFRAQSAQFYRGRTVWPQVAVAVQSVNRVCVCSRLQLCLTDMAEPTVPHTAVTIW